MVKILIYSRNVLERLNMRRILCENMDGCEVILSEKFEAVLEIMKEEAINLFIADIPYFDIEYRNMLSYVKKMHPRVPVLIISACTEKEILNYIWKLDIEDYFLKPFRPNWLVAAVEYLVKENISIGGKKVNPLNKTYMKKISDGITDFKFRNCTDSAKEYLDLLYEQVNNIEDIRFNVIKFAEGICKLGEVFDYEVQLKNSKVMTHFKSRYEIQCKKYDTYIVFEKIIDMIFELLEREKIYALNDEQCMKNYIDRNIKRRISLDDVAEYVNMSSCYFSKFFKKVTKEKFISYVINRRIEVAKHMLVDTDMPVINIAYELSYGETNYFSKTFKKKVGVTPSDYRNNYRNTVKDIV